MGAVWVDMWRAAPFIGGIQKHIGIDQSGDQSAKEDQENSKSDGSRLHYTANESGL
jgi:hypothetical protein